MFAKSNSLLTRLFRRTPTTIRNPKPKHTRLGLTVLEGREMPAGITASLTGGVLTVTGTPGDDVITVVQTGNTITAAGGSFSASSVTKVVVHGLGGNDTIRNNTAKTSVLTGDGGSDTIYGGSGTDQIFGGTNNDFLYGGDGSDDLYGEQGDDYMYGASGYDGVENGPCNDTLQGGDGADKMYGGYGSDILIGGNDGLFAGVYDGRETLVGGAGDDRFLIPAGEDVIADFDWVKDARLTFSNSPALSGVALAGQSGTYSFAAGSWTNADIQRVDVALANLQAQGGGNTRLLKKADWGEMSFLAVGAQTDSNAFRSGGWNNNGQIVYVDLPNTSDIGVQRTVYHEFGHNWDDPSENLWANDFRKVSGWVESATPLSGYTASTGVGDNWQYQTAKAGTFARAYGKTNPFEDMATTWEAYYVNAYHGGAAGLTSQGLTANAAKWATLDTLFGYLRLAQ
jgi:hypothetical protein